MMTDIQIAQACKPRHITEIAETAGIAPEYLELYGNHKAKIDYRLLRENTNADGKLMPGRFASVELKTQEFNNAITIPSQAIVPEMGIDKVYLYKNGKAEPVTITKGIRNEARVQVLEGLSVGDTIITSGTLQLRTGLNVTLDEVN